MNANHEGDGVGFRCSACGHRAEQAEAEVEGLRKCPSCGEWVQGPQTNAGGDAAAKELSGGKVTGLVAAGVVLLVAVGLTVGALTPDPEPPSDEARKERAIAQQFSAWNGEHLGVTEELRRRLHDPESYEHVRTQYKDMGDHLFVVTDFRAKNGFGGLTLHKTLAEVGYDGTVLTLVEADLE